MISLKVMSTPKIRREIIGEKKKKSMRECSVKNAGRVPKPKEPQAGIDVRIQTQLVRWKQEQA